MAQVQEEPIFWDQHASRWNITLIFALVVAVLGIMTGYLLTILGLAMAVFSWLTTPRQYLLYRDRMIIVYGMPRTRVISFAEISHAELLALPFGERLRLRMVSGKRMMLMMRDPGSFLGHLEDALSRYHGEQSGGVIETYGTGLRPQSERQQRGEEPDAFAGDVSSAEPETYTGRLEGVSGSSGSYTEFDEGTTRISGSYSDSPAPDYSGEGTPAYDADVELETGTERRTDDPDRPPSPY